MSSWRSFISICRNYTDTPQKITINNAHIIRQIKTIETCTLVHLFCVWTTFYLCVSLFHLFVSLFHLFVCLFVLFVCFFCLLAFEPHVCFGPFLFLESIKSSGCPLDVHECLELQLLTWIFRVTTREQWKKNRLFRVYRELYDPVIWYLHVITINQYEESLLTNQYHGKWEGFFSWLTRRRMMWASWNGLPSLTLQRKAIWAFRYSIYICMYTH